MIAGLLSAPISGLYQLSISFLQSTNRPSVSILLSACREVILYIPIIYLLNAIGGFQGLIYAGTAACILSVILGLALSIHRYKKL